MNDAGSARLERLRVLCAELAAHDPSPGDAGSDDEWDGWMERIGADADLAGLISQTIHGGRLDPAELTRCRAASDRFGSCLDAGSLAEAYRLLGQR